MDEASYVLYVMPNNKVCDRVQALIPRGARILVQNVDHIPKEKRPAWLKGVPTLRCMYDAQIYQGTQAIDELQKYVYYMNVYHTSIERGKRFAAASKPPAPTTQSPRDAFLVPDDLPQSSPESKVTSPTTTIGGRKKETIQPLPPPDLGANGAPTAAPSAISTTISTNPNLQELGRPLVPAAS